MKCSYFIDVTSLCRFLAAGTGGGGSYFSEAF